MVFYFHNNRKSTFTNTPKNDFNKQIKIYKHSFIPTFVRETKKCIVMYVHTSTLKRKQVFHIAHTNTNNHVYLTNSLTQQHCVHVYTKILCKNSVVQNNKLI